MSEEWSKIKESGLLELYVLGELDLHDKAEVEATLAEHPALREELRSIERALMNYAYLKGKDAPPGLKAKILANIEDGGSPPSSDGAPSAQRGRLGGYLLGVALLTALAANLYFWRLQRQYRAESEAASIALETLREECDSRSQLYAAALDDGNTILPFQATENYPETRLYLSTNGSSRTNFLKVQNLPELAPGEIFQLWSLGAEENPVPLDLFDAASDLLAFEFVAGSTAYAITIEPSGGSTSPNLDRLIGVVEV